MAKRTRQVGLYAFSIHGRTEAGIIDYDAFFTALAEVPPVARQTGVGDDTVAVTLLERSAAQRWTARFVTGQQGLPPLFYDPATGTESTADLGERGLPRVWLTLGVDGSYAASAAW